MTTSETFSLISSVAACFSAIAAFIVAYQTSKQQKQAYKPELFMKGNSYSLEFNSNRNIKWKESINEDIIDWDLDLEIFNIGLGVAKNIRFSWNFPIHSFVGEVNNIAQQAFEPIYIKNKDNEYLELYRKDNIQCEVMSNWKTQKVNNHDFFLPFSRDNMKYPVKIPHAYQLLVEQYIFCSTKLKQKGHQDCLNLELPDLLLEISFLDIGNIKHKQHLLVKTNIYSVRIVDENTIKYGISIKPFQQ